MQRVQYLIEKLSELSKSQRTLTAIDIDLMLDYTRVMYADLLEERKKAGFQNIQPEETKVTNEQDTLQQPKANAPEPKSTTIYNDLRTVIGINDKYLFISELFSGDKTAYEEAIKQLSQITSEEEALTWVKKELDATLNWDSNDETVKSFYNLVSSSFS